MESTYDELLENLGLMKTHTDTGEARFGVHRRRADEKDGGGVHSKRVVGEPRLDEGRRRVVGHLKNVQQV